MPYRDKSVQKKYLQEHYKANSERYKDAHKRGRVRNKALILELKKNGCTSCGYNVHPDCLEFHHADSAKKDSTISNAIRDNWSVKRLLAEVEKCILLCANCHRLAHISK